MYIPQHSENNQLTAFISLRGTGRFWPCVPQAKMYERFQTTNCGSICEFSRAEQVSYVANQAPKLPRSQDWKAKSAGKSWRAVFRCISWSPVLSFTYSCPFMFLMKWQRQQPQATRCLEHTRRRCKPSVGAWLSYLLYLESCCLFKGWFMCSESNQNRLARPTAIPQLYHVNAWISYTHAMVHWCQETSVSLLWSLSFNSQHSR